MDRHYGNLYYQNTWFLSFGGKQSFDGMVALVGMLSWVAYRAQSNNPGSIAPLTPTCHDGAIRLAMFTSGGS